MLKLVIKSSHDDDDSNDDNDEDDDDADEDHRGGPPQGRPRHAGDQVGLLWKKQPSSQCDVRHQGDNLNVTCLDWKHG